jgi:hypothetical protein
MEAKMFPSDFGTGTDMGLGSLLLTVVVVIVLIVLAGLVLGPGLQAVWKTLGPLLTMLG